MRQVSCRSHVNTTHHTTTTTTQQQQQQYNLVRLRFYRRGASTPLWGVESCSLPSRRPNPIPAVPSNVVRTPVLCALLACVIVSSASAYTSAGPSSLKQNGVVTFVSTLGYTDSHIAHSTHIGSGAELLLFSLIYDQRLVRTVQRHDTLACSQQ